MKKIDYRVSQIPDTKEFKDKLSNAAEIEGHRLPVVLVAETRDAMMDIVRKIDSLPYVMETREWAWKQWITDGESMSRLRLAVTTRRSTLIRQ
jgi:hypothetical protein